MKCEMCQDERNDVYRVGPENPGPDDNYYIDVCPDCHIYCFEATGFPKENPEG